MVPSTYALTPACNAGLSRPAAIATTAVGPISHVRTRSSPCDLASNNNTSVLKPMADLCPPPLSPNSKNKNFADFSRDKLTVHQELLVARDPRIEDEEEEEEEVVVTSVGHSLGVGSKDAVTTTMAGSGGGGGGPPPPPPPAGMGMKVMVGKSGAATIIKSGSFRRHRVRDFFEKRVLNHSHFNWVVQIFCT